MVCDYQFQHEKRRKQYDKYINALKEATGASVEEEDHAESLKEFNRI